MIKMEKDKLNTLGDSIDVVISDLDSHMYIKQSDLELIEKRVIPSLRYRHINMKSLLKASSACLRMQKGRKFNKNKPEEILIKVTVEDFSIMTREIRKAARDATWMSRDYYYEQIANGIKDIVRNVEMIYEEDSRLVYELRKLKKSERK